jgi:two-component system, cell cycle response regulator DivK
MKRVLVVEDSAVNMKLAVFLLGKSGYEPIEAYNAKDGISLAYERRPDLILMDIQLPDMDGLAVTRTLKADARTRDIKIVAMTASAMNGDREKFIAAGCDGYISKPFIIDDFQKMVGEMIAI